MLVSQSVNKKEVNPRIEQKRARDAQMHGGGFIALVERKQKQGVIAPRSKRKASPEAVDPGDQADFYPIWIDVCCLFFAFGSGRL